MNSLLCLLIIASVCQTGFALKCWNCPMDANPTKPCLQADPNVNATGFKVETCTGKDPACTKTSAKLSFGGKNFEITARNCQESFKAFAGKCLDNQKIPGPNGQQMETSLCACDSDKCNSAPFSAQMSLFGLLLTTIISAINNTF